MAAKTLLSVEKRDKCHNLDPQETISDTFRSMNTSANINSNCNALNDTSDNENSKQGEIENTEPHTVLSSAVPDGDYTSAANVPQLNEQQKPLYIKPAEDPYQKAWKYLLRHNILHTFQASNVYRTTSVQLT